MRSREHFDPEVVKRGLAIIRDDLHCNAVQVIGGGCNGQPANQSADSMACYHRQQRLLTMARQAITKTLSLRPDETRRFERLVKRFGGGSTTEFVRAAMDRLEAAEVAEELADLRRYGQRRSRQLGRANVDVREAVHKTLNP